ncbi:membrane-associated, 16S rRNA-binding GTPase [Syntrophobacter sp. SbD1]|nr:membrane-associated, 16S rRNA-binding GTPase [Syntrophobacter sp. SbD1]
MMHSGEKQDFKSGYIAIVGAPNVGKSTLLNQLLKQKISITAPKPQTTRNRVSGILNGEGYQIIFVDTPGIHKAQDEFNRGLVETALSTISESDAVLFMIEAEAAQPANQLILDNLRRIKTPVLLVINKVDLLRNKGELLPLIQAYGERFDFKAVIPISALKGEGTDDILAEVLSILPQGPQYFPEDYITDQPERFFAAELIREKIFHLLHQEIPYSIAVTIEKFTDLPDRNLIEIDAVINVERESQKAIIIGKGGQMLKEVGKQARLEIETFLGCHIYLGLFVRIQKNWRKDPRALREFGYSRSAD